MTALQEGLDGVRAVLPADADVAVGPPEVVHFVVLRAKAPRTLVGAPRDGRPNRDRRIMCAYALCAPALADLVSGHLVEGHPRGRHSELLPCAETLRPS